MNVSWLTYLPGIIREWLDGRQQFRKTIGNTGWLLFDRILRMVIGITIGAWVARYLGPSQFGELAYVISFIAFFQVVADLQADGFIVRDIAQERGEASVILGTALRLRMVIGCIAWLCAPVLMWILHREDPQLALLTAIVGGTMIFQSAETVDLWFQSQSKSKITVLAKSVAYLFSNSVKVILLLSKAPLIAFAGVMCLEGATFALSLAVAYRRYPTGDRWTIRFSQARTLLHQCWPFMLSGLMMTSYMRIDQIMLKEMLGEYELGLFAAALPVATVWTVIPTTLITSLAPFVARKMHQDEEQYKAALVQIFRYFAIAALLGAVLTSLASPWIIRMMYGAPYQPSAAILGTYVFVNVFAFQGIAQTLWVVNSNVRSITLLGTFLAAVIGIVANAVLIRKFGVMGAAYSILLTQGASVVVLPCLFRRDLRELYKRAFIPFKVYRQP